MNRVFRNRKLLSQEKLREALLVQMSNLKYLRFRQLSTGVGRAAKSWNPKNAVCMQCVLRVRQKLQIINTRIHFIAILVIPFHSFWARPDEAFAHKLMNRASFSDSILTNIYRCVPFAARK